MPGIAINPSGFSGRSGALKKGAARPVDSGPKEGHRRGDAGGCPLPKSPGRDFFVTKLQQSPILPPAVRHDLAAHPRRRNVSLLVFVDGGAPPLQRPKKNQSAVCLPHVAGSRYLRRIHQLRASSAIPKAPESMPCLARMRIKPVSCPGKNVGSASAGTRK